MAWGLQHIALLGDSVGGIAGGIGLIGMVFTLYLQRRELILQRKELIETRKEIAMQVKYLKKQSEIMDKELIYLSRPILESSWTSVSNNGCISLVVSNVGRELAVIKNIAIWSNKEKLIMDIGDSMANWLNKRMQEAKDKWPNRVIPSFDEELPEYSEFRVGAGAFYRILRLKDATKVDVDGFEEVFGDLMVRIHFRERGGEQRENHFCQFDISDLRQVKATTSYTGDGAISLLE